MAAVGADGVNGDTFQGIPRTYREASDRTDHPIAFQPEVGMDTDEFLMWDQQSWGYWHYPFDPLVSELKVLEPRHMVNVCDRWALDRTDNLQAAFFNGAGYVSWENVWGIWNRITPRDGEALRRISAIYRQFAPLLVSQEWRPGVPTRQFGVFASEFPGENETLWTIVNRNKYDVDGQMLSVKHIDGVKYYDLMAGHELEISTSGGQDVLKLPLEARGYGAVLMTRQPSSELESFLKRMQRFTAQPLNNYSNEWRVLPQKLVEIRRTRSYQTPPAGMVSIPAARYDFLVSGIEIEGGNNRGVDVQYPWEDSPRRQHHHALDIAGFYLDKYPVTNAQFAEFLKRSHYHPRDDHNFLKDWSNGTYPDGWANKPVTWVSLDDARAYAAEAGKRLPREWEWQYAAQGLDGRRYPWGNDALNDATPTPQTGHILIGPSEVNAHPSGASPFGVMDMIGNVFEWTDEYVDDHTRAAILRGDGYYHPQGSQWYFPHPQRLSEHAKYLLMAPSKDRSGTLGFRCAADR
jgi:formylglycine-generating enzyme required for sulfatase activity